MHAFRRVVSFCAPVGLLFSGLFLGLVAPATAANVNYVVNVATDKSIYRPDEQAVITVTVANRGQQDASVGSVLALLGG